jgi:hypothetical protein
MPASNYRLNFGERQAYELPVAQRVLALIITPAELRFVHSQQACITYHLLSMPTNFDVKRSSVGGDGGGREALSGGVGGCNSVPKPRARLARSNWSFSSWQERSRTVIGRVAAICHGSCIVNDTFGMGMSNGFDGLDRPSMSLFC